MSEVKELAVKASTITNNRLPDKLIDINPINIKASRTGNPRDHINTADYNNLKASIQAYNGIHTPIAVWEVDGEYEIVYGDTRRKICIELNIESIPALVKDIKSQDEAHKLALSENIDRNKMTLLQEAKGLKKIVVQCGGDLKAASSSMGWSESKFKKALQLLKATIKVQSLIGIKQPNDFILSEGHAAQLSLVPPKMQDRLVDSIIHQKMTINQVSTQLKKNISIPLSNAPFNKKECSTCEYNSSQQTALLPSLGFDDDSCGNPICYKSKNEEYFQNKMVEMEKEHGKIVLKSTIAVAMEVSADLVGEKQLSQCKRCDMHCAILNDKTELGQGKINENQCIDPICLKDKMKKLISIKKNTPKVNTPSITSTKTSEKKKDNTDTHHKESDLTNVAEVNKEVTIPKRCKFGAQKEIRVVAGSILQEQENYALAIAVASLESSLGNGCITTHIDKLIKKEKAELEKLRDAHINKLTTEYQSFSCNMEKQLIKCAQTNIKGFTENAINAWVPTVENLTDMTKQIRVMALEDSGFSVAFKKENSDKDYSELLAKKSAEQVKNILEFDFDWSNYAPSYYVECITKPVYNH